MASNSSNVTLKITENNKKKLAFRKRLERLASKEVRVGWVDGEQYSGINSRNDGMSVATVAQRLNDGGYYWSAVIGQNVYIPPRPFMDFAFNNTEDIATYLGATILEYLSDEGSRGTNKPLRDLGVALVQELKHVMENESLFTPLSQATLQYKESTGAPPDMFQETGKLMDSINYKIVNRNSGDD